MSGSRDEYGDRLADMRMSIELGHMAEEFYLWDMGIVIPPKNYTDWLSAWLLGEGWVKNERSSD